MSDIVERLRYTAQIRAQHRSDTDPIKLECIEAAAEITRLRNELHIAQEWSARVIAGREQDITEITALRAEVERLRAALEPFAEASLWCGPEHEFLTVKRSDCDKGRAALEEKP